jgi:hypothetical protein
MYIHRILTNRSGKIRVYHSYLEFINAKREYWAANHEASYQQLRNHIRLVNGSEKALEELYKLPDGSLQGTHLVYGSIREMREAVSNEATRTALINGTLRFVINIIAETRMVKVCTMDQHGDLSIFREYQLTHNFYGVAIMEDPIVSVG